MTKPLRIYVAGPVTSKDPQQVKKNIEAARKIGEELLKKGHHPYVQHTHFSEWNIDIHKHYEQLYSHGEGILSDWADAFFYIGPSNGADREKAQAEKLGLKIFTSLEDVPDAE